MLPSANAVLADLQKRLAKNSKKGKKPDSLHEQQPDQTDQLHQYYLRSRKPPSATNPAPKKKTVTSLKPGIVNPGKKTTPKFHINPASFYSKPSAPVSLPPPPPAPTQLTQASTPAGQPISKLIGLAPHTSQPHTSQSQPASPSSESDSDSLHSTDSSQTSSLPDSPTSDPHQSPPPTPPPAMAAAATPDQIRLIIQQTLGNLGPQLDAQGAVQADGQNRPTLMEKLTTLKKKADNPKPPGPSIFGGASDDNPIEWRDKITDYIEHGGYTEDADQMRIVKMYLKGRAAIWFKNLNEDQKDTLDHFKDAFKSKFLEGESKYSAQQALYARKQLPGEEPETYIEDVLIKADMLQWTKDQTLQHLIGGLQESLKPYVIMANPTTLEGTCDVILRAHNANKSNLVNQGLPGIQSALSEILTQVKADKTPRKATCAVVTAQPHAETCPQPQQQPMLSPQQPPRPRRKPPPPPPVQAQPPIIINTMQPQPYSRPRPRIPRRFPRNDRPTTNAPRPDQGNACWTCGSYSHWKNECPQNNMPQYQRSPRQNFQRRRGPSGPPPPQQQFRQPRPIFKHQENY